MTSDLWLAAHPYLRSLAELAARVDRAAAEIDTLEAGIPGWEDYQADYAAGVPLLASAAAVDLEPGGRMAGTLLERLAASKSSGLLAGETRALHTALRAEPPPIRFHPNSIDEPR